MRALVTGNKGFLGRRFQDELERRGYNVVGLDVKTALSQDCRAYFRRAPNASYDLVVHCAAVVGGRETIENDPLATAECFSIDAEMFRWAARARPGRVVYLSSSAAYPVVLQGAKYRHPLNEGDLIVPPDMTSVRDPDQVYGWSKVIGEILADRLRDTGVPVTVVRPFSGYGADQDPAYPFPAFIGRAVRRDDPFVIWGSGNQVRDFVHVDDIVAGTLAVADSGTADPVNLCTGRGTSFNELVRIVCEATGYDPGILYYPDAPTGVFYRVGDPTRMFTHYTPKTSLEDGIRRALEAGGGHG